MKALLSRLFGRAVTEEQATANHISQPGDMSRVLPPSWTALDHTCVTCKRHMITIHLEIHDVLNLLLWEPSAFNSASNGLHSCTDRACVCVCSLLTMLVCPFDQALVHTIM